MSKYILLVTFAFSISVFAKQSVFDILTNPKAYVDRTVKLTGVYCANKDAIMLYSSKEHCLLNQKKYGVALDLPKSYYIKRELFGHLKPVTVIGKVELKKASEVRDNHIYLKNVEFSYIRRYEVDYYLGAVEGKARTQLIKFTNEWLKALKKDNKQKVLDGLGQIGDSIENSERARWVLYDAPTSIASTTISEKIIKVYRFYNAEYDLNQNAVCYLSSDISFTTFSQLPMPLESERNICLVTSEIDDVVYIDASWLLY